MSTVTSTIKETAEMYAPAPSVTTQVTVNDQLVQIDNLVTAINYLHEELRSRQLEMLNEVEVGRMVQEYLGNSRFHRRMLDYHKRYQIPQINRAVIDEVKADIDSHLESYILSKIDERVELALNNRASN